jgi:NAD-specific glutamate dehydrogenase
MAYSKIVLFDQLLDSPVPDDPYLGKELFRYFPERMAKQFPDELAEHKLRREIISTMLANSMINRGGASFVSRLMEETGHGVADIASAYAMARDTLTAWTAAKGPVLARTERSMAEMIDNGELTLAKVTVAGSYLQDLLST